MVALSSSIEWWARTDPNRLAMVYQDRRVSYAELGDRVAAAAGFIASRGVRPGDVVALLMKNSAAFIELALAVSHAGAVLLPINYRLGADEVAYILGHAGAALLFCDEELRDAAGAARCVVVAEPAQADSRVLAQGCAPLREPHPSRPDDLYRLMYTSGTTDRPKGVIHTYANSAWR